MSLLEAASIHVQNRIMIIASIVGLVLFGFACLSISLIWYRSNWRAEQIYSLERIGLFVAAVVAASERPASGVSPTVLGDLAGDWDRVRSELSERYTFRTWLETGRMTHAVQDRQARALSTLARKKTDPLLAKLSKSSIGPIKPALVDQVFAVLSLDLDDLASAKVRVIKISAAEPATERAGAVAGAVTLLRALGPAQNKAPAQTHAA